VSEIATVVASVAEGTPALAAAAATAAAAAVVVDLVVAPADTVALGAAVAHYLAGQPLLAKLQLDERLRPFQAACEPLEFRQQVLCRRLGNIAGQREDLSLQPVMWPMPQEHHHNQESLPRIRHQPASCQASIPQVVRIAHMDSPLQQCC